MVNFVVFEEGYCREMKTFMKDLAARHGREVFAEEG
jgi:hypothetical protein